MAVSSVNNQLNTNYEHLSTIKRINSTKELLDALGIANYDLTGEFDIQKIDDATKKISASRSCIEVLDVPRYESDINENKILDEYRMFAQSAMTGQATRGISILLGSHS